VPSWRRNLVAVTAASFIGFAGFTLVMPFLPLYFQQLGVEDVGEVALWTGLSLGVTPAITALLAPVLGPPRRSFGRKIMVERSLASFVVVMAAMAWVTEAWQIFALRAVQGLFAGYGALTLTMAADVAPKDRVPFAIGFVQTAQRLGPGDRPGAGRRRGAPRRAAARVPGHRGVLPDSRCCSCSSCTTSAASGPPTRARSGTRDLPQRPGVPELPAADGCHLRPAVHRSELRPGTAALRGRAGTPTSRVPIVAGVLFSLAAAAGAVGHYWCGRLLRQMSARRGHRREYGRRRRRRDLVRLRARHVDPVHRRRRSSAPPSASRPPRPTPRPTA
jgi:hypothetical protein